MSVRDKILTLAAIKKVFRAEDLDVSPGTARKELLRLADANVIERIGYGLYSLKGTDFTERQSILEVAAKTPSAVLCLISALRFHDLTSQNPFEVWIAIPREARIPKIETTHARVFRFAKKVYEAGIENHVIEGVEIKVYSPAKTIADCFYYRRTVGQDVALEALRDAWRMRRVTMDALYHFAQVRNVKSTMLPYLTTLT